jgi:hypothetical protein
MFLEMVRNYCEMICRSRGQAATARGHKKGASLKPLGPNWFRDRKRIAIGPCGVGSATNQRKKTGSKQLPKYVGLFAAGSLEREQSVGIAPA